MPATARLYTSVIPLKPEIWASKVSWATDLSPTGILHCAGAALTLSVHRAGSGGVPGVGWDGWYRVGTGRVYYPGTPQDPYLVIFSHIPEARPYPRP